MRSAIKKLPRAAIAVLAAGLAACTTVDTSPDTFNVDLPDLDLGAKTVALRNGYSESAPHSFPFRSGTRVVDQMKITDTAIVMFRRALDKQSLAASTGDKAITLRVRWPTAYRSGYPGQNEQNVASLSIEAEFGDGSVTTVSVANPSAMSLRRTFEGAVLFALNKLLVDERFLAYMRK